MMATAVADGPTQAEQLRSSVRDPCAHGPSPCGSCQEARVLATVNALERGRLQALSDISKMAEEGASPGAIQKVADEAIDGIPRDTQLDAAMTLLAKCHATMRRAKTPRPDPTLLREIADLLGEVGIEVRDD